MSVNFSWLGDNSIDNTILPCSDVQAHHLYPFYEQLGDKLEASQLAELEALILKLSSETDESVNKVAQLHKALYGSVFVQQQCLTSPQTIFELLDQFEEGSDKKLPFKSVESHTETINTHISEETDDVELMRILRRHRNRMMVHIIWRDLNRLASTQETCQELSYLAKASIQTALDFHYRVLSQKWGAPLDREGIKQPMLILGMGKLGAEELNLSSDIDLIFCYPQTGETQNDAKNLTNQEFFTRLGKQIINALDTQTADGFVFRVDMRLRPYGQSGPLVSHFDALENYYQTQGREWERYAMIKARVVATSGSTAQTNELMTLLRSFSFRRYIDFSVIEALRKLKSLINQEVKRRGLENDVKLGSGGIREIEFIAQAFQLIRGGRDQELQDNRLVHILPLLENMSCLPDGTADKLIQAYYFLRDTEHAIQAYRDEQTQQLPTTEEEQLRLALIMGYDTWNDFYLTLEQHRAFVRDEFQAVVASPDDKQEDGDESLGIWENVWHQSFNDEETLKLFDENQHEDTEKSLALLDELRTSPTVISLPSSGRERLDQFMPRLLATISNTSAPTETLSRIMQLVKSVVRRSAYLLLLIENPKALEHLVRLSTASPWIANELADHPALLDELLDQHSLYRPPAKEELEDELRRTTLRIAEGDLETQMDTLRYFRSAHALRVAASEVSDALPLMKVSDYLTWLAEAILNYTLLSVWREMIERYGYPDGIETEQPGFVIIGYGKLGGIELGHGSDLDLVFIHDANPNGSTNGKKSIDNQTFYMRMGQKIIHMLTTNMASGQLYEVDMRLRPSGNSGMLVSSLAAFEKYQLESAWTWEHQALVRARVVAGSDALSQRFSDVRERILCTVRDESKLQKDVIEMRLKMRDHLGNDKNNEGTLAFNIKQDPGGIVDIEFMVQYAVLAWANADSALVTYTDNIRILECLENAKRLSTQEVDELIEAYKAFRATGHRLTLQQQPNLIESDQLLSDRQNVIGIWNKMLGSS